MSESKKTHLEILNLNDVVICAPVLGRNGITKDVFLPMCFCTTEGRSGEASYYVSIPVPVEEFRAGWHKFDKSLYEDYKKAFCSGSENLHYAWPETDGNTTPRGVKCFIENESIDKYRDQFTMQGRIVEGQQEAFIRPLEGYKVVITKILHTSCRGKLVPIEYNPIDRPKFERREKEVKPARPSYMDIMNQAKAAAKGPIKTLTLAQIEALNNNMGRFKKVNPKGKKQK